VLILKKEKKPSFPAYRFFPAKIKYLNPSSRLEEAAKVEGTPLLLCGWRYTGGRETKPNYQAF
jgi:hypothetical protein